MPASPSSSETPSMRSGPRKSSSRASVVGYGDLATSLLFVFPLLLVYEAAVIFSPVANGVDFVSRNLFALVGRSKTNYLIVHLVLGVGFVALLAWLKKKRRFKARS